MSDLDVHLPAIAAGDADAFARWLAGAELPLRHSLRSFAAQVDVEPILQEALLRTWQFAPRIRPDGRTNSLLRYAHRVARNLAIDTVRRAARRPEQPLDDAPEPVAPTSELPDPGLAEAIRWCLSKLPGQPAAALTARLTDQAPSPDTELAEAVGMRLNTFLKNIGRARALLQTCLAGRGVQTPWEAP